MKLGAARIFVRSFTEAKTFYADRLGLRIEACDDSHGFCMFDTGAAKLIVESIGDHDDEGERLVGRFTGLSFPVDDIQATHRELSALGVEFSGVPEQQPWGGWLATFRDPSGNGLQLAQQ
ncbi:putative enzyme related to lactoylglutathione lyase [Povalibacter uvarum]|uniref:Putative enzyme related to lactoylglutathione lyase n=1 Tax=Povalibacter uvarum TaxID=732238 RepID=A0A841HP44_9GAMM|nr:VOC family protein [Povalibacter uvarum]MBB6095071.1 putative enzyme related to lactoylglutathione lyase [Povalibacter uvarum]